MASACDFVSEGGIAKIFAKGDAKDVQPGSMKGKLREYFSHPRMSQELGALGRSSPRLHGRRSVPSIGRVF